MPAPWTINDWNGVIDSINSRLSECDSDTTPLPHVFPPHRWSTSDVSAAQNALTAKCNGLTFGPIPRLWKRSIIDELSAAVGNCNCCETAEAVAQDGLEVTLFTPGHVVIPSFDDPGGPYGIGSWPVRENIEGFLLAIPGYKFRDWTFTAYSGPIVRYERGGSIRCDGTVDASTVDPDDELQETVYDIVGSSCVFADPDVGGPTPECQALLDIVTAREQRYVLRLTSVLAECCSPTA
jgi:hypothetical protein